MPKIMGTHFVDLSETLIDRDDYLRLKNYKYYLYKGERGYLFRVSTKVIDGKRPTFSLHQDIMGKPPKGMVIDHINRNKTDNRKCNLRFVTVNQNVQNTERDRNSPYQGVYKQVNKYFSKTTINKKTVVFVRDYNPIICAIAYDNHMLSKFDNPKLNFPTIRARKKALCEWSKANVIS